MDTIMNMLSTGDLINLTASLPSDERVVLVHPSGHRRVASLIGTVMIGTVEDETGQNIVIHTHSDVAAAKACFDAKIDQLPLLMAIAGPDERPRVWINGVEQDYTSGVAVPMTVDPTAAYLEALYSL